MQRPTLVSLLVAWTVLPQAQAQDAGAAGAPPAFVASFRYAPLRVARHPALAPGGRLGPRVSPAVVAAAWEQAIRAARPPALALAPPDSGRAAPPPAVDPAAAPRVFRGAGAPSRVLGTYAELGMEVALRVELRADRFRNLRCTTQDRQLAISGCDAAFPTLGLNPQYAVRTAGVVGRRLHVDVDFDSEREFEANNNLQVWYEGLEDEVVRRVEAGNVTFQAPPSRFITAGVPANNFGVQAVAQLGAVELRGIYAQQKGNLVRDRVYSIGEITSQPLDREARDLDVEVGRFFFAVDPAALPAFPAVDILTLAPALLPDSLRVGSLRVYRLRALAPASGGNQNIGGIQAVACGVGPVAALDCAGQRAGPFQWEILQEGRDYYVDPSGAWFALGSRLDQTDYLAVSFVTASGTDSVGTFPAAANPDTAVVDTLRLVYDPRPGVTAAAATFRFEIRNAYRLGGQEITRETAELTLTVNRRERTLSTDQTYLASLGLAVESDPNRLDQYNRLFPRTRDPQQGAPLRDFFVVLPHLTPFADSTRLLAAERNDSLYRTPRPLLATQGPPSVFALRLRAAVAASTERSVLSLNSFQIREGSERIYVGNALLIRDVDYTIDYAVGQLQFKNPDSLFQTGVALVRAQFEERAAFTIAPTSIYGLAARYDLGAHGEVNVTGMFQREQSTFTRPPLGFEPASSFIGGVSTQLRFEPAWVTRLVDALPGVRTDAPSFLTIAAEVAASKPQPNQLGQAYVEEFEDEQGRFLSLSENAWHWGSLPCGDPRTGCTEGARGAEAFGISPAGFDVTNLAALTWQGLPLSASGPVQFLPQQIDPAIRTTGQSQSAEPVLWLMLKPDTVLGLANSTTGLPNWVRPAQNAPRWRSITQPLATTGVDLSRVEVLEFWVWEDNRRVAKTNRTGLLLDFGAVFEDGIAVVPDSFTVTGSDTTYRGARLAGAGRLDTERDPRTQSWSATLNDQGILTDRVVDGIRDATAATTLDTLPLCSAAQNGQLVLYFFGDLRSRCGRRNGAVDSEDLDGDFRLDSAVGVRVAEDFVRYVFPIGDERYYVRDGGMIAAPDSLGGGASGWRLYRIPFRLDSLQIGRPNLRQVQAIRLTVVVPQGAAPGTPDPQVFFALSRVRLVGSTWLKRAETPIPGLAGDRGTGVGEVAVTGISTADPNLGYTSPPGVTDLPAQTGANLQVGSTEINERSLRLLARGLGAGERAEAFLRFTAEGDKNFLRYGRLHAWARGRGPGWEDGDLEFYLKVGKDPGNFYFYRARARTTSWEPEVVVHLDRWLALRAAVEQAWLSGAPPQAGPGCPDTTFLPADSAYVACDGPYLVHVRDPGTAPPNLASVQEIAVGILRVNERLFIDQAELWVDDIRLGDVVQDAGYAGAIDVSLTGANLFDVSLNLTRRDGQFRQLDDDPRFVTDDALSIGGTARLERFLPARWGLAAPLTIRYVETESTPFYLSGTDVRADALEGLRTPRAKAASYALSLRRTRRSSGILGRLLLDPVGLSGTYATGDTRSDLATATSSSYAVSLDYTLSPPDASVALAGLRLRLSPQSLRLRSGLVHNEAQRSVFEVPVARLADSAVVPASSLTRLWRNSAGVDLVPTGGVQLRMDMTSVRDLRDYGDSTTMGLVAQQESHALFGRDIGFESQRVVGTLVALTPRGPAWLRPRATLSSTFALTRDPNASRPVRDSAGAFHLPTSFSNGQRVDLGAQLDVGGMGRRLLADSGTLARVLAWLAPVDISLARTLSSVYSQTALTPSFGYQLALGGLDGLRSESGVLAASASRTTNLALAGGVTLPLRVRLRVGYQQAQGLTWVRRNEEQVPFRTRALDWPSLGATWSVTPPGAVGRVLTSLTLQANYRDREVENEQPSVAGGANISRTSDQSFAPSVALTWRGGILTSFDVVASENEQLLAGNVFRNARDQQNARVSFAFPSPLRVTRTPATIRTTARYSIARQTTCLQSRGQPACVPYVDSRQDDAQLTLDTSLSPNLSAGFQMAYVVNEERQANRKVAQLLITAFFSLTASVGQFR